MTDIMQSLRNLKRPRMLVSAARIGTENYNRSRDLKRLIDASATPSPTRAVNTLISKEAQIEETRKTGDAAYSVGKHVEILIALMAEAQLLPTRPKAV